MKKKKLDKRIEEKLRTSITKYGFKLIDVRREKINPLLKIKHGGIEDNLKVDSEEKDFSLEHTAFIITPNKPLKEYNSFRSRLNQYALLSKNFILIGLNEAYASLMNWLDEPNLSNDRFNCFCTFNGEANSRIYSGNEYTAGIKIYNTTFLEKIGKVKFKRSRIVRLIISSKGKIQKLKDEKNYREVEEFNLTTSVGIFPFLFPEQYNKEIAEKIMKQFTMGEYHPWEDEMGRTYQKPFFSIGTKNLLDSIKDGKTREAIENNMRPNSYKIAVEEENY